MTKETKAKLIAAGKQFLVDIHELNMSGYAGVTKEGTIVDRREYPDATPIQENPLFNVVKPKKL